ncbi:MAG: hypothetical protein JST93_31080 [Acidobacteria bacterium]|nr:hypothetical protein [Acidobacteriota bacterium]
MPLLASLLLISSLAHAAAETADPWRNILTAVNIESGVILPNEAATIDAQQLQARLSQGESVILEGASPHAEALGIHATGKTVRVFSTIDLREPKLPIIWENPTDTPVFELPAHAQVFVKEKREGIPLLAGFQQGKGAVLWAATSPGPTGHERYPYILQALTDLGVQAPVHSRRLWLFLDTSYRLRTDPVYMARLWRKNGVAALHIAAWHFFEADEAKDLFLRTLIGAAHQNAIHVYAWLELPHVSERFWQDHPAWREKTANGDDAHLDWRKLMNLRNPECTAAVRTGVQDLLRRFDWDGVNLAELYFESLEGHANPTRFTPMNTDVRREFQRVSGFDPSQLFDESGPKHWSHNASGLIQFLEYRVELARALQSQWIGFINDMRKELPHLDLALTHVDNLLQPETRERIGADVKRLLPMMDQQDFTFLVEDPATAWSLGAERYLSIASKYAPLTKKPHRLAIDINVVERYQDVYPTKQQVGTELFREIHLAASAFPRLTLYFESSIRRTDWPLVGAAAAAVRSIRKEEGKVIIDSAQDVGVRWEGGARVDGVFWPVTDAGILWLPAGKHTLESAPAGPQIRLTELNADLKSAWSDASTIEFSYESTARAFASLDKPIRKLQIDGVVTEPKLWIFEDSWILVLPRGQHLVTISTQ